MIETSILVVDDEPAVHALVRKALAPLRFPIDEASGASEALARLDAAPYALIITDLMMPGLDGLQLLELLRERASCVPVLMITGCPTIRTALLAMRLGAQDYLTKPFSSRDLIAPVLRALRLSDAQRPAECEPANASCLALGDTVCLPRHAWARLEQDGTFSVGVEASFIQGVGKTSSISCPAVGSIVDQGFEGIRFTSKEGESHAARMPLTGEVLMINELAIRAPAAVNACHWLIRVVPRHLPDELGLLARKAPQ